MSSNTMNDENMFSVGELFCKQGAKDTYVIPIYQRNYDWGREQIRQLIQDVFDYAQRNKEQNYYIGSLVVWQRNASHYEVVDGQQRLTTLLILLTVLWQHRQQHGCDIKQPNAQTLTFEIRQDAAKTLTALCETKNGIVDADKLPQTFNTSIYAAYQSMMGHLGAIIHEHGAGEQSDEATQIREFCTYLLERVHIFRVTLPKKTDLNHYFEVMNNRGEQLEQHEVVKAKLLSALDDNARNIFNAIWNKCANMNRYIQEQFKGTGVFDAQEMFDVQSPQKLFDKLSDTPSESHAAFGRTVSLKEMLEPKPDEQQKNKNGDAEQPERADRFEAVVDFPNFLMHVLRLHILSKENLQEFPPLDDKQVQSIHKKYLKNAIENKKSESVLEFIYDMLKYRFLLDTYVVKRVNHSGEWKFELKRAKWTKNRGYYAVNTFGVDEEDEQPDQSARHPEHTALNTQAMMLLSMFHVNTPAQNYKNWLSGALRYLDRVYSVDSSKSVNPTDYVRYLEHLAYAFFRRAVVDNPPAYADIIYKENIDISALSGNIAEKLNRGTGVRHYIFYYLDYLLWRDEKKEGEDDKRKYRDFQFTFHDSASVEHWLPRSALPGTRENAEQDRLDHFGNLALIPRSKNSRLSVRSQQEKASHIMSNAEKRTASCKLREMAEKTLEEKPKKEWNATKIDTHGKKMQDLLLTPPSQ